MRRLPTARPVPALFLLILLCPAAWAAGLPDRSGERERGPQRLTQEELDARIAGSASQAAVGERFGLAPLGGPGPAMPWTPLGPRPLLNEYWSSDRPASGRASAIAVDPRATDRVYVAAAQGGVWRSENAGLSWVPLTDGLPSLASGDVALDPVNPDIVWYGTGEQHFSGDSYYGDGLFKSTDRGATWTKIADRNVVGSYIARVVPYAGAANTIVVASNLGLVRSTDGGSNWSVFHPTTGYATDLEADPTDRMHLLGAIAGGGVYRSIDGGATWTLQTGGLPIGTFGRVNLALAADGQRAYASFVSNSGGLAAMARSNDGGATWVTLPGTPNYMLTQGWYDNTVAVHRANPDIVVAGGVYPYDGVNGGIVSSTDGGTTWTNITRGIDGLGVHPDQHRLVFAPDGRLWLANDGGVFLTEDGGSTWKARNDGLETIQFYTVGLHSSNPSIMSGGTQDNGTAYYNGSLDWPQLVAGDGGPTGFEWSTPSTLYSTYVALNPLYKWNLTSYVGTVTGPWAGAGQPADWANGGFAIDPNQAATVLVGTDRVYRSTNSGASWLTISPDLTGSSPLKSITPARDDPGFIWAGSAAGRVYRTTDDGLTWDTPVAGLPLAGAVNDISTRPGDGYDAILGLDRSFGDRVFRFDKDSDSWISITSDLPTGLRVQSLAVDWRGARPHLFAGTDHGVYANLDSTWFLAGTGLPAVAIYDLAVDTVNDRLVAATHGRSMWRTTIDGTAPVVAVTYPTGGEDLELGTNAALTWNATDLGGVTSVDLVLDDATNALTRTLATGVPNTGSFNWVVSAPLADDVRLRVTARDAWGNVGEDSSAGPFRIVGTVDAAGAGTPAAVSLARVDATGAPGPVELAWALPRATTVRLTVHDLQGRLVATLARGAFAAGRHASTWNAAVAMPGVYFARLETGAGGAMQRVLVAR